MIIKITNANIKAVALSMTLAFVAGEVQAQTQTAKIDYDGHSFMPKSMSSDGKARLVTLNQERDYDYSGPGKEILTIYSPDFEEEKVISHNLRPTSVVTTRSRRCTGLVISKCDSSDITSNRRKCVARRYGRECDRS